MSAHWYALHTYSGHENKVKTYLESLIESAAAESSISQVVVPTEEVVEMRAGKKTVTKKRFLPSYVLVEMEMNKEAWHQVTNIPGVTNFVGPGRKPQALTQEEVDRILGQIDRRKSQDVEDIPFSIADQVKVNDGAFKDFIGTVQEVIPEKRRLKIMVSIFAAPLSNWTCCRSNRWMKLSRAGSRLSRSGHRHGHLAG